ncbi:hypothetical protein QDR66_08160 [Acinetobacter baumannii]|uniref:hypothetical protein n=1 Tax=Acinetobacter baumannii TaxID=470 RepID=UPI00244A9347|nr:hypothetical protein [Acinetobacter baumannii]MDH2540500.1 hypothetical protein [Acinetobacter baumannii]
MLDQSFFLNLNFWSLIIAFFALLVSLFPHIKHLLKGKKIDLDIHKKIIVYHWVGFPSLNIHLGLFNKGGAKVNIKSINLKITKDGNLVTTLKCQGFFETSVSQTANTFFPFDLPADDSWTHLCWFAMDIDRNREQKAKNAIVAVDMNIAEKIRANVANTQPIEAESELVDHLVSLHNQNFIWETGEYFAEIQVETNPVVKISKKFRFTLYETEVNELNNYTLEYKYGFAYGHQKNKFVFSQISD